MKRIASLIFVCLMIGLPPALGQDAAFDEMAAMEMEMGSAEMGGLVAILAGIWLVILLIAIIFLSLIIVCMWKVLNKTGRPGPLALLNLVGLGIIPFIMNLIDMKKIGRGAGSIVGLIFIPVIMYPIVAFSKGGAAAAPLLEIDRELDEVPQTEASAVADRRLAATDVSRNARAGAGAFSGATGFTIVAMLGLFIFIAVITLQCLEIFHLDGTMDDGNSIWPPKP
jgi:hypothetical protein